MIEILLYFSGVPKALLPVGELPLISHWMPILEVTESIDDVYVVVCFLGYLYM